MGLVLISLEKTIIEKSLRLGFLATNNEAEYKGWPWYRRWEEK